MTRPVIFPIAAGSPAVTALLGVSPTRFWPFSRAPDNPVRPYAVHQMVYGTPQNTLACPPDIDNDGVQIDAYGRNDDEAWDVADALRDAFEAAGHNVVSKNGDDWEPATGLYRVSFTVEFWTNR